MIQSNPVNRGRTTGGESKERVVSPLEITMLICFGAAWPFSIYKSLKTREVSGKSLLFLVVVLVGYISGICHKLFYRYDRVIFLYALNAVFVLTDILLYLRNRLYHIRQSLEDS